MSKELRKRSDQFDIRLNVPNNKTLTAVLENVHRMYKRGSIRYVHVSGVEIGDIPDRTSFGERHVHIALILFNPTSKGSVIKKFVLETIHGWYIEPRDKTKSLSGWLAYHGKMRTKVQPAKDFLVRLGKFPTGRRHRTAEEKERDEDLKRSERYQQWERRKYLIKSMDWETLDLEFPGFIYSGPGQALRREILKQSTDEFCKPLEGALQNFMIWGPSGTGKSASVAYLYPNCYKKQKGTQFWDGYDKTNPDHSIVWIDEMSKETLACMTGKADGGFEFLKELADRYPVTVDEKYTKGFKIRPKKIIITMNEHPTSLLPDRAVEVNKQALFRKFKILHVSDWLAIHALECTTTGVIPAPWTYIEGFAKLPTVTGQPLPSPDNHSISSPDNQPFSSPPSPQSFSILPSTTHVDDVTNFLDNATRS